MAVIQKPVLWLLPSMGTYVTLLKKVNLKPYKSHQWSSVCKVSNVTLQVGWWTELLAKTFLQEPHGVTTQKTPFFIVTAMKTSNLTSDKFV
jgi:hypothetical protein